MNQTDIFSRKNSEDSEDFENYSQANTTGYANQWKYKEMIHDKSSQIKEAVNEDVSSQSDKTDLTLKKSNDVDSIKK